MAETIARVEAYAVRIPRDFEASLGTAGSPVVLAPRSGLRYRWASTYRALYSEHVETTLVRVETTSGMVGWGEAQSPVAPEITRAVVDTLLGPLIIGEDALAHEALWDRMYAAMRVRGHTGSFLLDSMAGIDLAIWDLCGKAFGQPVFRLLGGPCRRTLRCYVSGLTGTTPEEQIADAKRLYGEGARAFKVFLPGSEADCLATMRGVREALGPDVWLAVDALWRLNVARAARLADSLAELDVAWLEAPLPPEDVSGHAALSARTRVPIAVGESYRTRFELLPFFERGAVGVLQPDLGRSGLTEARKLAALAGAFHVPVAPHVSIGLGPQLAAALHFAAATADLLIVECNPHVYALASRHAEPALQWSVRGLVPPDGPGLGVAIDETAIRPYIT